MPLRLKVSQGAAKNIGILYECQAEVSQRLLIMIILEITKSVDFTTDCKNSHHNLEKL